jgi:hypothetical protein
MISKEEFIKLYCDEFIYKATGVVGVADYKVAKRLKIDMIKTQQDLEDYGYPLDDVEIDGEDVLMSWDIDNLGVVPSHRGGNNVFETLQREIENITRGLATGKGRQQKTFDPDNFDWGGEDSIK